MTYQDLAAALWGSRSSIDLARGRRLALIVYRIRTNLGASAGDYIRTVRQVGYHLSVA